MATINPDETDVLDIWESFPDWLKGATIFLLLTYLVTFMVANYWSDMISIEMATILVYWPFAILIWAALIWFGFSLIIMVGVWIGGQMSAGQKHPEILLRAKKVALFIPIVVGSVISVSVIFMSDIFRSRNK